jgi:diacylglycerol O-acyltransferase
MSVTAEKLTFLDASFLRLESAPRPFHVAGLMLFTLPGDASPRFMRELAGHCGRLNELWPVFDKKLRDPESVRNLAWVPADDYDPAYHVYHYALPAPGRMDDLLSLVSRVHERLLDRNRPLWELHLIEGLEGGRFALYCKVHHALVDGVGALQMVNALFSTSPDEAIDFRTAEPIAEAHHQRISLARQVGKAGAELRKHYAALPQLSSMLAQMGVDALMGKQDVPPLPFTAPRTILNGEIDARRQIVITELPLKKIHDLAAAAGGTINDVLVAVCGGALREYLQQQDALPKETLEAGIPISIKRPDQDVGNQVSFIICPFYTNERDPLRRLKRIIKVSRKAKSDFRNMTPTAAQDFANALLMPTLLLTLTGNSTLVKPPLNAIVSNVPGSKQRLYLNGASLEKMYPLSVVTDAMGLNITVVSYMSKLCFAITSCPTDQPGIGELGRMITRSYRELVVATKELQQKSRDST